jgi:nucleoid-associated protein YgaU
MQNVTKAQFQRIQPDGTLVGAPLWVLFNPTEYTLNKGMQFAEVGIPGLDAPIIQFVRGQSETLTLDLFFDTTEKGTGTGNVTAVTIETDKFYQLLKIDGERHAPTILYFSWGDLSFPGSSFSATYASQKREHGFKCLVESVRQRFTLFSPRGIPLRAVLTVNLKEYKTLQEQIAQLNLRSADQTKAHIVQEGETLAQIAAREYDDPREWRTIARYNGLTDPLALEPGMVLRLPPTE